MGPSPLLPSRGCRLDTLCVAGSCGNRTCSSCQFLHSFCRHNDANKKAPPSCPNLQQTDLYEEKASVKEHGQAAEFFSPVLFHLSLGSCLGTEPCKPTQWHCVTPVDTTEPAVTWSVLCHSLPMMLVNTMGSRARTRAILATATRRA